MYTLNIKHHKTLNSTNSYALANFNDLNTADIIVADVQTNGRGRFDRVWEGESSQNIYMSIVLKPQTSNFPYMNVTQYLSVVLNRILNRDYDVKSNIKWPNDILFEGRKLVGILSEAVTEGSKIAGVVIGVGINVNSEAKKLKNVPNAISIKEILGHETEKNELLNKLANEFFEGLNDFSMKGFSGFKDEYIQMCKFNSNKVKISGSFIDGEYEFLKINDDGTLSVYDDKRNVVNVVSGDIVC